MTALVNNQSLIPSYFNYGLKGDDPPVDLTDTNTDSSSASLTLSSVLGRI